MLEYEEVLHRQHLGVSLSANAINAIIDYHCSVARLHEVFFLWRPFLRDPKDEMVLELAVKAECDFIITHNKRDFHNAMIFGVRVLTPGEFLRQQGLLA